MGDEQGRRTLGEEDLAHRVPDRAPGVRVERSEGLVEQHELRPGGERPGQRDPLLLAAGELAWLAGAEPGEPDDLEQLLDPSTSARVPSGQREADVGGHVEVGEESALLRDEADPAGIRREGPLRSGDAGAAEVDRAVVRPLEAGEEAEQRRLAAPARPEDGEETAALLVEVQVAEHGLVAVAEGQAADVDGRHQSPHTDRRDRRKAGTEATRTSASA